MPLERQERSPEQSSRSYLPMDLCGKSGIIAILVQLRRAMISWFTSLRFALNDSPTVSNNVLTRVTSHNRSRSVTAPAGRQRLTPSRRRRWREGHRIDVGVSARSRAPTTQRTIMVGRFGRVVMRRDGTGRGRRLIPSGRWRRRWRSGSLVRRHRPHPADRGTPLTERTGGTPYAHRPQPNQIFRDRNSLPAEPAGYSPLGNTPFLLNRRVPGRNL
jgi:hypothetical protein